LGDDVTDPATLQTWLTQAETARNAILTGQNPTRLRHGQKDMTFNEANLPALVQYINELRAALGQPLLVVGYRRARRLLVG
jgi:arylsulfatase A-like enzyme